MSATSTQKYEYGSLYRAQIEDWRPRHRRTTAKVVGAIVVAGGLVFGGVAIANAETMDSAPGQVQPESDEDVASGLEEIQLDFEGTGSSSTGQLD